MLGLDMLGLDMLGLDMLGLDVLGLDVLGLDMLGILIAESLICHGSGLRPARKPRTETSQFYSVDPISKSSIRRNTPLADIRSPGARLRI
jgi:hypothetical protein